MKRGGAASNSLGASPVAHTLVLSLAVAFGLAGTGMTAGHARAAASLHVSAPQEIEVFDTPNDAGNSLTLVWPPSTADGSGLRYHILAAGASGDRDPDRLRVVADIPSTTHYVRDQGSPWWTRSAPSDYHLYRLRSSETFPLHNGRSYWVTVAAVTEGHRAVSPLSTAVPEPNWVNWNLANNFGFLVFFGGGVLWSIRAAGRREIFLRRIPGLDAVDEAIGRSTELGKPVLYLTGAGDMSEPATIAASMILGRVAGRVAAFDTTLLVPHRDPMVMAVCQEITWQAYQEAGKPDLFRPEANFFITTDQFSYTAAVDGLMLRQKPAANFFLGSYFAESLLLTETGASTGAIQIAGTDSDHQLPFFVTTCDYTLIGEELYAASAYLSRDPVQVGTLRGQDLGKGLVLLALVGGTVLASLVTIVNLPLVPALLELFKDFK